MNKQFILDVPKGETSCKSCPFQLNIDVCKFICENKYCKNYNFNNLHIEDIAD